MRRLLIEPDGWPCLLAECPAGHFVYEDQLGFKSEYHGEGNRIEAFCDSGEFFVTQNVMVQPVIARWVEEDR